jgi:hypothetical protein
MFGMKEVQRPASVLVTALDHDFDGFTGATVGLDRFGVGTFCVHKVFVGCFGIAVDADAR